MRRRLMTVVSRLSGFLSRVVILDDMNIGAPAFRDIPNEEDESLFDTTLQYVLYVFLSLSLLALSENNV